MTFDRRKATIVAPFLLLAGCVDSHALLDDRNQVVNAIQQRMKPGDGSVLVPDTVNLADGLSESEAVQLALYNNAAFHELLTDLGLAQADVIQAGLLPNPEIVYFFPTDPKPYKYLVDLPIEALWLRPFRERAASAESDRTRERLTQAGLDLTRDTRLAHADWVLARERIRIAEENLKLRDRITTLAEARLKAGDARPLEVSTAKIDSLRARQESIRAAHDLPIFEERLRNLIGLGVTRTDLSPVLVTPAVANEGDVNALTTEAVASRPDVLAARHAIVAADARIKLADLGWLRFLGIADATSGKNGHELGPALRTTLPIFNWNQGAIARANGERDRAVRQLETVRERAILDVRVAWAQYTQAASDLRQWTTEIHPAVDVAIRQAESTYEKGETTLLLVLETSRQLIESRAREAQLRADMLKARAELERSVGRRLSTESEFATDRKAP